MLLSDPGLSKSRLVYSRLTQDLETLNRSNLQGLVGDLRTFSRETVQDGHELGVGRLEREGRERGDFL